MKPVYQQEQHDPEKGIWGDCHRAALASLLELRLSDVPHFCKGGAPDWRDKERAWLAGRGLLPILGAVPVNTQADALRYIASINPDPEKCFILSGESSVDGLNHSVICLGERVVHDTDPEALKGQPALSGPMRDVGNFFVACFVVSLLPGMRAPKPPRAASPGFHKPFVSALDVFRAGS